VTKNAPDKNLKISFQLIFIVEIQHVIPVVAKYREGYLFLLTVREHGVGLQCIQQNPFAASYNQVFSAYR
jgi:hypothetical protein